ncbi:ATP-binding protein [Massilia yuzhufengensis]|uniref:histidine kinase n=1 Tax=Massilia yuzhufengensis TaxID=1164594 RepID=A0A1I1EUE1_9BURK|nr:ATP-binding protein [Massilia yuzhufengensis]SFB90312.1 Bacteriophytochrome (light-regulated signal transduction histidine kinase) [Massilia yuzhufengensis]
MKGTSVIPMEHGRQVDLLSCADEPIHIPGSIQPHGALLFFTAGGALEGWSANAATLLDIDLIPGTHFTALALPAAALELLCEFAGAGDLDATPSVAPVSIGGADFDCIVHAGFDRVVAEFEQREVGADEVALFAVKAHGSIDRLRRQKTIDALLASAVTQIREFTGFDRVMAYRFRADDSGDVVAESRRDELTPYLGQRYPAGDIPAQARRLYILNTLRSIVDVDYQAVPMLGAPGALPLDMSHAVLRSVSPIHVEYLKNMGVGASMSVSIVINGRLWGLIACHHMARRLVPYAIRMAADVLAQVIGSTIHSIEARLESQLVESAASTRSKLIEDLLLDDDPLETFGRHADGLMAAAHGQALVAAYYGKLQARGDLPPGLADAILASLPENGHEMVVRESLADWPAELHARLGKWVGMLALPYDPAGAGWIVVLRVEQIEQVAWGGRPEKTTALGPLGERLTPRGSFDAWHETVRGRAQPWEATVLANARLTQAELVRVMTSRRAQTEATRAQLLAMLGHDLRDPLHSINMAGMVLEKGHSQPTLGKRIQSSTSRMQRMISQVLDMSRIDGGIGLGVALGPVNLSELVEDLIDEARMAYPAIPFELACDAPATVNADSGRLAQVLSNLLSNARHHGEAGKPVRVCVKVEGKEVVVDVSNAGGEIAPEMVATLFNPFKRASLNNPRNRTGMGLGLYIAQQIVREHHGDIAYRHEGGEVIFSVRLPLLQTA